MEQSRAFLERPDSALGTRPRGFCGLSGYLESFLRSRRALDRSERTIDEYRLACRVFSTFLEARYQEDDVRRVTRRDIEDFLIEYQETRSRTTANKTFRGLRAVFNWLWREEEIETNPFLRVEAPRPDATLREGYDPHEVTAMLRALRQEGRAARKRSNRREFLASWDYALLLVLYDTGLRATEIVAMTTEGVDWKEGLFTVTGKGRQLYKRHLGDRAVAAIDRYLRLRRRLVRETGSGALWIGWTAFR